MDDDYQYEEQDQYYENEEIEPWDGVSEPKIEQFDDYDVFIDARTDWKINKAKEVA